MSEQPGSADRTVDGGRQNVGSAGWDLLDDDSDESPADVPKPDPDKDQG